MLGLISLPGNRPQVAASLQAAFQDAVRLDSLKARNPMAFRHALPNGWAPMLDFLTDNRLQREKANREPYIHPPIEAINRKSPHWIAARLTYDLRARALWARLRAAGLTGAITWNGQISNRAVAARAAADLGIPMLFAELSPFGGRFFLDHLGVNASSSLHAVKPEDLPSYEDEEQLFAALKGGYLGRRSSNSTPRDASELPPSFVFAPLQVPSDTQIMLHGGAVRSHAEFLSILSELLPMLPARTTLAVKPHPSSPYSEAYLRATIGSGILVASNFETRDLLERCEAIVTVNSTVGIDGFLFDKPIIAVGNAPWIKPALAHQARTATDIAAALADLPAFDRTLRMRLLAHWYHACTWHEHEKPEILKQLVDDKMALARAATDAL